MSEPPPSNRTSWLNRTVLGIALTSLASDWSHEMATAVLPALLISLIAVGVSGLGVPYILNVGLWALAAGSAFTFGQRVHAVYKAAKAPRDEGEPTGDQQG